MPPTALRTRPTQPILKHKPDLAQAAHRLLQDGPLPNQQEIRRFQQPPVITDQPLQVHSNALQSDMARVVCLDVPEEVHERLLDGRLGGDVQDIVLGVEQQRDVGLCARRTGQVHGDMDAVEGKGHGAGFAVYTEELAVETWLGGVVESAVLITVVSDDDWAARWR